MAGLVTHLVIANKIIEALPVGTITNKPLFYAGSLAPDGIHAREDYVRAYKKHTHMRDDIPDIDFHNRENLTLFYNRVTDFIHEYCFRKDGLLDLYRGYIVHLLTDELFVLTVRQEFVDQMNQIGIAQNDILFYNNIINDINCNDYRLVKDYSQMESIWECLEKVEPYSIDNYLTKDELNNSRNWVIQTFFYQEHSITEPSYFKYDRLLSYIDETAVDIVSRLSDGIILPKIF